MIDDVLCVSTVRFCCTWLSKLTEHGACCFLAGTGGAAQAGSWNPFSLATYQQYFDVDTVQVTDRLRRALSIKNEMFFENEMLPDMYGPFWLCTTLVRVLNVIRNGPLHQLFSSRTIATRKAIEYWSTLQLTQQANAQVFVMAAAGNLGSLLSFVPTEDQQVT